MKTKKKKYKLSNLAKIIKIVVIPLTLFLTALLLSTFIIFTYTTSFTTLPYDHISNAKLNPSTGRMLKGSVAEGEFTAQDDYLGTIKVAIRNFTGGGSEEDRIVFSIKEKGGNNWYYTNTYSGGQFHELDMFPFGFPLITNSKDKTYVFKIESLKGNDSDALTLTGKSPLLTSTYQFPKSALLHNSNLLKHFILSKIQYAFKNRDILFLVIFFFLPLMIYPFVSNKFDNFYHKQGLGDVSYVALAPILKNEILLFSKKKLENNNANAITIILLLLTFLSTIFLKSDNTIPFYFLSALWVICIILFKTKNIVSLIASFLSLTFCTICLILNQSIVAKEFAVWVIIFMIVSVCQSFWAITLKKEI